MTIEYDKSGAERREKNFISPKYNFSHEVRISRDSSVVFELERDDIVRLS